MSKFLKALLKAKKNNNSLVKKQFSNVPRTIAEYVKIHGRLPFSIIKNYQDNTGKPLSFVFPKKKAVLFNIKPR